MRIVYYSDNFYPELSGIVDSIMTTGAELKKRGHEVAYVGPHYLPKHYTMVGKEDTELVAKGKMEFVCDMPVVRLPSIALPSSPTGQSRMAFSYRDSFGFLEQFQPDIIHTQSPYGCGLEAKKAAKAFGVPLVGTNHTAIEVFYPQMPWLMRQYDAWYYNHCQFVTAPFGGLINRMREMGFNQPGQGLPNPVVRTLFTPPTPGEKAQIRHEYGLIGPVVLYAGRVAPEKHLDVVMRSIVKLVPAFPSIKLVITGHGPSVKELQKLVRELQLDEHVFFTGFVAREVLAKLYKAADVFTIMSTADSQSIALMQAYSTGIPAIGARSQGLPDYIPAECGFLLEPGDGDGLTKQLLALLQDEQLRTTMGAAGLEFVSKMSPEHIADEWEKIYAQAIKNPRV